MKVRQAVIPAAGLGINFLPITKTIPKELLPIIDKTCLEYVFAEGISAGVEEFIVVISKEKQIIRDYFEDSQYMIDWLRNRHLDNLIPTLNPLPKNIKLTFVYQDEPLGLGHAVYCAHKHITDDNFFVLLPDDIIDAEPPVTNQLLKVYAFQQRPTIAVMEVPWEDVCRYGIVQATPVSEHVGAVQNIVEKPTRQEAPSNLAVMGRYLLPKNIFSYIVKTKPGAGGEIQLTDAIRNIIADTGVNSYVFEGERFDTGEPLGLLLANLVFSLKHPVYKDKIQKTVKMLSAGI